MGRPTGETGRHLRTDDQFETGSNTKTFTATLILQLVAEGRLRLYRDVVPVDLTATCRMLGWCVGHGRPPWASGSWCAVRHGGGGVRGAATGEDDDAAGSGAAGRAAGERSWPTHQQAPVD